MNVAENSIAMFLVILCCVLTTETKTFHISAITLEGKKTVNLYGMVFTQLGQIENDILVRQYVFDTRNNLQTRSDRHK